MYNNVIAIAIDSARKFFTSKLFQDKRCHTAYPILSAFWQARQSLESSLGWIQRNTPWPKEYGFSSFTARFSGSILCLMVF